MELANLKIIGTSHIAKESLSEIQREFESFKPSMVAVELDRRRLHGLMHPEEQSKPGLGDIKRIGVKGYLFALIGGYVQKKLGGMVGVAPGSEMKLAVELAKKNNLKVALIDQDIEITLRKFSERLSWKERFRFIADIFKATLFRKKAEEEFGLKGVDLSKVPEKELIKKMIGQLKKRYPNIYQVLVADRNRIMSRNIAMILKHEPDVRLLAVVGAGHEEEMLELIKKILSGQAEMV